MRVNEETDVDMSEINITQVFERSSRSKIIINTLGN